ncbi:hypothetical protein [Sphaerisporangium siamense]|uniref:Uncharacterized protein n=1 Tax=Sphaerisporangium siamense TaxID=795645 RepID=A0A7W7GAN0_9ACTN|nr:hypothetical protein [Sphaerisporangium siamense]MBB4700181.1 hypothetical protein [Sphaerisporangium siamense]
MSVRTRAYCERGDSVEDPTSEDLGRLVSGLTRSNRFVIVERLDAANSEYYMQAYLRDDGAYWLEYRNGGADTHFQTTCLTPQVLKRVFTMWRYSMPGWLDWFVWQPWFHDPDARDSGV